MINIGYGGDLVRRAAANVTSTVTSTVSSTVSTVASVATGSSRRKSTERRGHRGLSIQGKEKVTLVLKVIVTVVNFARKHD